MVVLLMSEPASKYSDNKEHRSTWRRHVVGRTGCVSRRLAVGDGGRRGARLAHAGALTAALSAAERGGKTLAEDPDSRGNDRPRGEISGSR